jgi:hypothetical protein
MRETKFDSHSKSQPLHYRIFFHLTRLMYAVLQTS